MCKLFAVSNASGMTRKMIADTLEFVNERYAVSQRDGFGFSIECQGGRHTERYVSPKTYLGMGNLRDAVKSVDPFFGDPYLLMFESPERPFIRASGPLIAHGRTSTGIVSLPNTHPFTKSGWTLAHNGVVNWTGKPRKMETDCDSEHLLNCYALGKGTADFEDLGGWAAWVAINPSGELVAGRDHLTTLYLAYSKKFETYILATKSEDLEDYLKAMGIKSPGILAMPPNTESTFDPHGKGVTGRQHKGLNSKKWQGMEKSGQIALGVGSLWHAHKAHTAATSNQILGYSTASTEYSTAAAAYGAQTEGWPEYDGVSDVPEDLLESVRQWEKGNLHTMP